MPVKCCKEIALSDNFIIDVDDTDLVLPKVPLALVLTNLISNAIKHLGMTLPKVVMTCDALIDILSTAGTGLAYSGKSQFINL
jgi:signal transduction histidine kinase